MFFVLQIPITDLRGFVNERVCRVEADPIPLAKRRKTRRTLRRNQRLAQSKVANEKHGFVRRFGSVQERPRQGAGLFWPAEDVFCDGTNAVRFDSRLSKGRWPLYRFPNRSPIPLLCRLRRFLSDGLCVSRFEVGLLERAPRKEERLAHDLMAFAERCLSLNVRTYGSEAIWSLPRAGETLAKLYLRATTQNGCLDRIHDWWVEPGEPLCLVEYADGQSGSVPLGSKAIHIPGGTGIRLDYARVEAGGTSIGAWFCQISEYADRDFLRRLRINLFRLHSELESLKHVTAAWKRKRLRPNPTSDQIHSLKKYLEKGKDLLTRKYRYGIEQVRIVEAVQEYRDVVFEGERPTLLAQVEEALDWINLELYKARMERKSGTTFTGDLILPGGIKMGDMFSGITNSQIINRSLVEKSFNKVAQKDKEAAEFLQQVAEEVHNSGNKDAGELFDAFNEDVVHPARTGHGS